MKQTVKTLEWALLVSGMFLSRGLLAEQNGPDPISPDRYNVVWDSPSQDFTGSMPLGNGDIGLNAWVEPNGDLVFYISKTDSWGDNGRLLKVGRVRIKFDPAPTTTPFRQTLRLGNATLAAVFGEGESATTVCLWVDANHPVIHVTAESPTPLTATAQIELWRDQSEELPTIEVSDVMLDRSKPKSQHGPTIVEPDTVLTDLAGRIGWYHHNRKSVGPQITAEIQGLTGFERDDPLLHRTFGAVVTADNAKRLDDLQLESSDSTSHRFSIHVLTEHPATPAEWLAAVDQSIATVEATPFQDRRAAHDAWWHQFWNRSWIHVTTDEQAEPASLIPANELPVKIGVDRGGGSRLRGELGRMSIIQRPLGDEEIAHLADVGHDQPLPKEDDTLLSGAPEIGTALADSAPWAFAKGVTIEAWIKPDKQNSGGGRIVDKITVGGSDGFLFDTWPGNSLRLIVGRQILHQRNVLPAGEWTHVAAVVDNAHGQLAMYLNGKPLEAQHSDTHDDAFVVSRGYALQRFIDACQGRGRYPIKFNGAIFTVPHPGAPGDADYRRWGPGYWWQNTRLPYMSMCTAGDFEMMRPLFRMYVDELLPLCRYRTRHYMDHGGAYYPECIYFWGDVFSETYGWTPADQREDKLQASGWHKWEWVCGPELVWMMFDYYEHTLDETFLRDKLLPAAHEVLTFFDEHYQTDDGGKLVMHPSQAVETWWMCTNPMPELAGLHAVTARLLALPEPLTTAEQRAGWTRLREKLPDLPTRDVDGAAALAPAEKFANKRNIENPELYAVFPFRLVSFEKPNAPLGLEALKHRWDRGNSGWRQDDVFMAYLGLANDARQNLVGRARRHHPGSRFPAFWGPNYDWVPDQDHGGILTKALQAMLLQTEGRKIYLLPAWPSDWNVQFKLHAPYNTTLEGQVKDGKLTSLTVTPENRRKDIVIVPQSSPGTP